MKQEVVIPPSKTLAVATRDGILSVSVLSRPQGDNAARRFLEFFTATIRNKNTRMAYYRVSGAAPRLVRSSQDRRDCRDIEPLHVAAYVEALGQRFREADRQAAPGRHPHAVRLARHRPGRRAPIRPHSVRGPKHVVKTRQDHRCCRANEARELLDSIDTSTVVGLRDRALIG